MGTTGSGFWFPDTSYTSGVRQAFEDAADAAEGVMASRARQTFRPANAAALAALAGTYTLRVDDYAYQVDTGVAYRWDGATWGPLTDADTLLVSQAFTGASSVSVAGLTGFDAYEIEVQVTGTSVTNMVSMRLQSGGSDDSSANYDSQRVSASGATVAAAAVSAATSWADLPVSSRDLYVMKGTLFGLSSARQTLADLKVIAATSAANLLTVDWGLRHRSTAAFDGITLLPSSGTITGTITVFGKTK